MIESREDRRSLNFFWITAHNYFSSSPTSFIYLSPLPFTTPPREESFPKKNVLRAIIFHFPRINFFRASIFFFFWLSNTIVFVYIFHTLIIYCACVQIIIRKNAISLDSSNLSADFRITSRSK